MVRPGPKLSPNPGKTARYYRANPEARKKHNETNKKINSTEKKKKYRRDLMKIRRERGTPSNVDLSHKNGKIVQEDRKTNRGRGGARRA